MQNPTQGTMPEHISITKLKKLREEGQITREVYWSEIQERLRFIDELVAIAERENVTVEINKSGPKITIPLGYKNETVQMLLDVNDIRSVPFTVLADGPYEEFQASILFELGMNSRNFLDVGANMGYYTLALGKINPSLTIQSFEPQPKTFSQLKKNLSLNNLEARITAHNIGLGAKEDTLTMFIPKFTGSGGASFANLHDEEGSPQEVKVPVKGLDNHLNEENQVDLMKIDVEGYEFEMLVGSQKTINNHFPTIVIELLRKWMKPFGRHPQDVIELLSALGYITYSIGKNSLNEISMINEDTTETNFIFVHPRNSVHCNLLRKYI